MNRARSARDPRRPRPGGRARSLLRGRSARALALLAGCGLAVLVGCGQGSEADPDAALIQRGKVVYETSCSACHARAPGEDGPVGPAITGSSMELLRAKVLRNEYPAGYTPKRDTQAMVPLVHVEADLPAVHAYLESVAK